MNVIYVVIIFYYYMLMDFMISKNLSLNFSKYEKMKLYKM